MKLLISILIILMVILGAFKLWDYWDKVSQEQEQNQKAADGSDVDPKQLQGMYWDVEQIYNEALQKGPEAVKQFLDRFEKSPKFKDPRKAWVELDYVVSITGSDPVQAKQRFLTVKERVRTNSVVYPRLRAMAKTYE
jgi:ABC-type nitrate/sulfonate/bicarbonate transport system substrate-binding protein